MHGSTRPERDFPSPASPICTEVPSISSADGYYLSVQDACPLPVKIAPTDTAAMATMACLGIGADSRNNNSIAQPNAVTEQDYRQNLTTNTHLSSPEQSGDSDGFICLSCASA